MAGAGERFQMEGSLQNGEYLVVSLLSGFLALRRTEVRLEDCVGVDLKGNFLGAQGFMQGTSLNVTCI